MSGTGIRVTVDAEGYIAGYSVTSQNYGGPWSCEPVEDPDDPDDPDEECNLWDDSNEIGQCKSGSETYQAFEPGPVDVFGVIQIGVAGDCGSSRPSAGWCCTYDAGSGLWNCTCFCHKWEEGE